MRTILIGLLVVFVLSACGGKKTRTSPGQLQPGTAEYLANEGIGHLNGGRLDLAEKSLAEALKKNPQLPQALNGMALVRVYRREFKPAIEVLERLLRVSPKFYDAYNLLGAVYTELGQYEKAKENLLVAANAEEYMTPENAFANLVVLEIQQGKFEPALRYAEKGLMLNKRFAPLHNLKGLALEKLNRPAEAAESFEKALALLTSPDPGYLVNSARVAARLGDKKKALDQLELAMGKTRDEAQKAEIIRMIKALEGK
ncbi:MAG: tetratricopeptide repeat protein [Acidobacteria bacterium]|jgi:type IV pilus assembly protein PilF|nr:tetratricopeptide repeat protein [Acidobacteriota bacterium]